jgi:hypothetical protein
VVANFYECHSRESGDLLKKTGFRVKPGMTNKVEGVQVHNDGKWGIYDTSVCGGEITGQDLFK